MENIIKSKGYLLKKKIGEGTFATVYEVIDKNEENFAVKVI
jgi:serine/threonine protein kinase